MREIVLDTETTGFDPEAGDRIVEIGAVELWNHLPTRNVFHQYVNPQREMPQSAFEVHGLSNQFLSDKPVFKDIAELLLDFIGDSALVIHNATFDMKFLNFELKVAGYSPLPMSRAVDTLEIARKKFPGAPASLDALCRRFGVDNSVREKHGALLDSEILAEVYLELIGGRQPDLTLSFSVKSQINSQKKTINFGRRSTPLPLLQTAEEKAQHERFVQKLGPNSIWAQRSLT